MLGLVLGRGRGRGRGLRGFHKPPIRSPTGFEIMSNVIGREIALRWSSGDRQPAALRGAVGL